MEGWVEVPECGTDEMRVAGGPRCWAARPWMAEGAWLRCQAVSHFIAIEMSLLAHGTTQLAGEAEGGSWILP